MTPATLSGICRETDEGRREGYFGDVRRFIKKKTKKINSTTTNSDNTNRLSNTTHIRMVTLFEFFH
jgi:hypothetical protein